MSKRVSYEHVDLKVQSGKYAAQWQSWLDGSVWELVPGEDFTNSIKSFKAHCYYIARTYNTRIATAVKDTPDGPRFYLQADPPVTGAQPDA